MIGTHSAAGYDMQWTGWVISGRQLAGQPTYTQAGRLRWTARGARPLEMGSQFVSTPCLGECGVTIRHQEKPLCFPLRPGIWLVAPCGLVGTCRMKGVYFSSFFYALSSTRRCVRARIRCYPSFGAVSSWQVGLFVLTSQERSWTFTTSGPDTKARVSLGLHSVGFKNS